AVRRRARAPRAVELRGRRPRRDQRTDRVHVRALVAHHPPDPVDSGYGGRIVRAEPARQRVRIPVRDDLPRPAALRGRMPRSRRRPRGARRGTGRKVTMMTNNWTFVGAAYGAVWVAIGLYWFDVHCG